MGSRPDYHGDRFRSSSSRGCKGNLALEASDPRALPFSRLARRAPLVCSAPSPLSLLFVQVERVCLRTRKEGVFFLKEASSFYSKLCSRLSLSVSGERSRVFVSHTHAPVWPPQTLMLRPHSRQASPSRLAPALFVGEAETPGCRTSHRSLLRTFKLHPRRLHRAATRHPSSAPRRSTPHRTPALRLRCRHRPLGPRHGEEAPIPLDRRGPLLCKAGR